eukprot:339079-Amphidinium_carterae.1
MLSSWPLSTSDGKGPCETSSHDVCRHWAQVKGTSHIRTHPSPSLERVAIASAIFTIFVKE